MESTFSWNAIGGSFDIGAMFPCPTLREPRRVPDEPNTYERSTDEQNCVNCDVWKPAIEFYTRKHFRLGIARACKVCLLGKRHEITTAETQCGQCKKTLAPTEFTCDRRNLNGLNSKCKKCHSYERTVEDTVCFRCKNILPASEYFTNKNNSSGIQGKCKECTRQYNRSRSQSKRNPHV